MKMSQIPRRKQCELPQRDVRRDISLPNAGKESFLYDPLASCLENSRDTLISGAWGPHARRAGDIGRSKIEITGIRYGLQVC